MQDRDRPKFVELMQALAASFRVDPSPALFEGYWLGLKGLEIEAIAQAVATAIGTSKRMPVPAELRELSGDVPIAMKAVEAWAIVRGAASRIGAYESVDFGPLINAVIRTMGGWNRICTEEMNDFVRKDFERTLVALAASGFGQEMGEHLVGLHEIHNRAGNWEVKPPVRIGGVPEIPFNKRLGPSTEVGKYIEGLS